MLYSNCFPEPLKTRAKHTWTIFQKKPSLEEVGNEMLHGSWTFGISPDTDRDIWSEEDCLTVINMLSKSFDILSFDRNCVTIRPRGVEQVVVICVYFLCRVTKRGCICLTNHVRTVNVRHLNLVKLFIHRFRFPTNIHKLSH